MASARERIRLDDAELRTLYMEVRTCSFGTIGRDGHPHLSAMWFVILDDALSFWSYTKAQKTINLARDSRVSCLFEAGETYDELRGALVQGRAHLSDDDADALRVGTALMLRYNPGIDEAAAAELASRQAGKRTAIQVAVDRVASWDHRKL